MIDRSEFTEELNSVIDYMQKKLAYDIPTLSLTPTYLLLSILQEKKSIAYNKISTCLTSSSINEIQSQFANYLSTKALTAIKPGREPKFDIALENLFEKAKIEMKNLGKEKISSEHVILAILADDTPANKLGSLFKRAGLTYRTFLQKAAINNNNKQNTQNIGQFIINIPNGGNPQEMMKNIINGQNMFGDPFGLNKKGKQTNIEQYCLNISELVANNQIDKVVGREKETKEIIRVLGRRHKNNVVIVGPEGSGKTALAENLAHCIHDENVPEFLIGKELISLDMTSLIAGTTLRGMFEDRVKGVINEIKESGKYILLIDNIGAALADKGKNDYDITSMLSHSLENGDIQVIGTSDYKSYRSTFDKNPSLARKFQKINIDSPSVEESIEILNGIKKYYEDFHHVVYTDDAIKSCVILANKYITEKNLPDSAIDILDEAGSVVATSSTAKTEIKDIRNTIKEKNNLIVELKQNEEYSKADDLEKEIKTLVNKLNKIKEVNESYRKEHPDKIEEKVIFEIVSEKTGIPINKLTSDDKKKLLSLNENLKAEIIGQDEAIDTICKSLKRNRIGLSNNKCLCSYLLLGKTGVGKSMTAKMLAKEMFGSENAMVRFDMSEYPDKTSVNKLIGSNPGYIGYEDGGLLTEAIKNKKYCVLLMDEIEKADKDVYNIFLQILDEGMLTDNSGMKVDFKNVIVLFTSNVGAKTASDFSKGINFNDDENKSTKKIITKELKNKFPPEFLNRLNGVIYYNNLSNDDLKKIIKLEIEKSRKRINNIGYDITYNDNVVDHIFDIVKTEKEFGARPVIRTIQTEIEDKITDLLLENEYENGHVFDVSKFLA